MRAFINSKFQYCPLTRMFHCRKLNNNMNKLLERALRTTYGDNNSSFESLLEKDASTKIPAKNWKLMLTEIFKAKNDQNPEFILQASPLRNNHYSLRYNKEFLETKVKTISYGVKTIRVKGP